MKMGGILNIFSWFLQELQAKELERANKDIERARNDVESFEFALQQEKSRHAKREAELLVCPPILSSFVCL